MAKPETPLLTVDCVVVDARGRLLLIRRGRPPFQGQWALPGGFVGLDETVEDACRREVREETGVIVDQIELVGIYSQPGRDPRGPTCSIAFKASVIEGTPHGGDDAEAAQWMADWRQRNLAFDHSEMIADALGPRSRPRRARK